MNKFKIILANDHAGFEMKNYFKSKLLINEYEVEDFGNTIIDHLDDYPDFMHPAAEAFSKSSDNSFILVFGGSGVGESILLNRYENVRVLPVFTENLETLSKASSHDNINGIAFGARFVSNDFAYDLFKYFMSYNNNLDEKYIRREHIPLPR